MPNYLCEMTSVPSETNAQLKLPKNNFDTVAQPTDNTNTDAIVFSKKENLDNFLEQKCVPTSALNKGGGFLSSLISIIFFILFVGVIVYMFSGNLRKSNLPVSFGLSSKSFSF